MNFESPTPSTRVRRLTALQRVLLLMELIQPLHGGATLKELHSDVYEEFGELCERTVRRDLEVLISLDVVEKIDDRFVWTQSRRSMLFKAIIQDAAERKESEVGHEE